jgi:RimJ/RimL family protein N-acetyltransferase
MSAHSDSRSQPPPYRIETPRLVLRCWDPRDATLLKAAVDASVEHLRPWMPWIKDEPQTLDEKIDRLRQFRARFDRDEDYFYAILDPEESHVLGGTGLHQRRGPHAFEIGYWVAEHATGKGVATEVAAVLTRVGLEYCQRDRIEIRCDPANVASAAIPRKLGFTHEATLRRVDEGIGKGDLRDAMVWTLLRSESQNLQWVPPSIKAFDAAGRPVM